MGSDNVSAPSNQRAHNLRSHRIQDPAPVVDSATTKACIACPARKKSAETISNFQARARGGLRDRTIGDERFSESTGTIKKRKDKEEEVIVISHASDIVISSSSSSLQVKEQTEPVKATKVPVRKSTLSSGEVRTPLLSHIPNYPMS